MKLEYPSDAFDNAVSDVLHGIAKEASLVALNELLLRDPRALDEYIWRLEIHSHLASDSHLIVTPAPPILE